MFRPDNVSRHRSELPEMGRDEPAVGSREIALASEPEERTVYGNGGEEEHLIFEDCVVLCIISFRARYMDGRATYVRDERRRFSSCTPSHRIRQK